VYIPEAPELGMVLSYSYLWSSQHDRGETSGRKDRPAAIVVIRTDLGPDKIVYVVPITHSPPAEHDPTKILIPRQIKQRLGLDEEPSWVDISEYNASRGRTSPISGRPSKLSTPSPSSKPASMAIFREDFSLNSARH
jgi:hypothetical protein